jgi:GDPmannose 4,6-dehydratase
MVRRSSEETYERIKHILHRLELVDGDLLDQHSLTNILHRIQPDEVYNLGAQTFVPASFSQPLLTAEVTALGALRMLEAIRLIKPDARFYQASSSEMFGKVRETPQNEHTPFYPRSPYGVAKVFAHYATVNYRESYHLHASSGILFNHESPRRGLEFVTRKVTDGAARIKLGLSPSIALGNLDSKRDWGFAGDYVRAMWLMLQQNSPDDFVIATGVKHSVRELCELAFSHVGLNWQEHVEIDPALIRPADVNTLCGDSRRAREQLGWEPAVSFAGLVQMMVDADLERVAKEAT